MWPLGLCSLAMLYLAFHCWRETAGKKFIPYNILKQLSSALREHRFSDVFALLETSSSALSRSLKLALSKIQPGRPETGREKIEDALAAALDREENKTGQWINYLNVVAVIAPLIGLLGTVSGMIGAFQTIEHGGMGKPELLAGDIGEALVTTAAGLATGILAMIAYFITRHRLNNRLLDTTQTASLLLDALYSAPAPGSRSTPSNNPA